jgi:hypothetical protein
MGDGIMSVLVPVAATSDIWFGATIFFVGLLIGIGGPLAAEMQRARREKRAQRQQTLIDAQDAMLSVYNAFVQFETGSKASLKRVLQSHSKLEALIERMDHKEAREVLNRFLTATSGPITQQLSEDLKDYLRATLEVAQISDEANKLIGRLIRGEIRR